MVPCGQSDALSGEAGLPPRLQQGPGGTPAHPPPGVLSEDSPGFLTSLRGAPHPSPRAEPSWALQRVRSAHARPWELPSQGYMGSLQSPGLLIS